MRNLLTGGIGKIFDKIRGSAFISEQDFKDTIREVRFALLEADVSLEVVKAYINSIKEKVIGGDVIKGVSPGQMIIKIVQDELTKILGSEKSDLNLKSNSLVVIMMVGLQGSGKTTTTAKIAKRLKSVNNKKVLMASLDVYRPAAQKQLQILGEQIKIDTLEIVVDEQPLDITKRAINDAKKNYDVLILDTAGRLHMDTELMDELKQVKSLSDPSEILLVADSVTGQESVNIAKAFHEKLSITGIILTRMDGDARGGAALSMRYITNCPIKFLGYGEKIDALEEFHPERIAGRILNMGDVVSLVEQASQVISEKEVEEMTEKAQRGEFDFNDLAKQFKTVGKLGGIASIVKMIPGMGNLKLPDVMDDKLIKRNIAIINSMTKKERSSPNIINGKRKKRIATGSGTAASDINSLMKKFQQARGMIGKVSKMGDLDKMNLDAKEIFNLFSKR